MEFHKVKPKFRWPHNDRAELKRARQELFGEARLRLSKTPLASQTQNARHQERARWGGSLKKSHVLPCWEVGELQRAPRASLDLAEKLTLVLGSHTHTHTHTKTATDTEEGYKGHTVSQSTVTTGLSGGVHATDRN